jgi:hypothetical protein
MSDGDIAEKLYVLLGFEDKDARFLKPTSKTGYYDSRQELMSGCVVYASGQIPIFPKQRTIIDAAQNLWSIRRSHLSGALTRERGRIRGVMPQDFDGRLRKALSQARALGDGDREKRLSLIGPPSI